MAKKVFVSGCYDMLHSGHVAFFQEASNLGDLYVGLGSDETVYKLKGRRTINTNSERLFMVRSIIQPIQPSNHSTIQPSNHSTIQPIFTFNC